MSIGFNKFKVKIKRVWLLKNIAYGISVGAITAALLLLLSRLGAIGLQPWLSVLLGVGAALLTASCLLFVFYPTDRKIAKKLDRELGLNERVQTMVEFADMDGSMIELQRADTDNRLSAAPPSSIKFRRAWISCVTLVLSVCMLVGTFIIPTEADSTPPDNIENPSASWQIQRLKELISRVEKEWLGEEYKAFIVGELNVLLGVVEATEKESIMKVSAVNTVKNLQKELKDKNSAVPICEQLTKASNPILKKLSVTVLEFKFSKIKDCFEEFEDEISSAVEPITVISEFNDELALALASAGEHEDGFYKSLVKFSDGLAKIASSGNADGYKALVDGVFDEMSDSLDAQSDNKRVTDSVVKELVAIFNISESDLTEAGADIPSGDGSIVNPGDKPQPPELPDIDNPSTSGAPGKGELNIPSQDSVYNPETGKHNPYADMLLDYLTKYYTGIAGSKLDKDMLDALRIYFESLTP